MTFHCSEPLASKVGPCRQIAVHALACFVLSLASAAAQAQSDAAAKPITLPPVLVTATRFATDPATLPFGVQIISADDIRRAGANTVNEALMKLLGVPGRQDFYGGGDYALDLRGFGGTAGDNQLIVLDGIRLNEADLGGTRLAGIAIDTVERIEVIRGSGSVLYGEGATGGVILITTRAGSGAARAGSARVSALAGSFGQRELRAGATLVTGDVSLDVAGNRRLADNYRDNFRSDLKASSLGAQWRSGGLRIGLGHAEDKLDTRMPGALSAQQFVDNPRQTNTPNDKASISNYRDTLFAHARLDAWQFAFDAGWRSKGLKSEFSGFANDYEVNANNQALRAQHAAQFGGIANTLVLGLDHGGWNRVFPAFGSTAAQQSHASYVRDELRLAGGTRLSAGWRTEALRKTNSGASTAVDERQNAWELGLLTPLADTLSGYARLGKSFRLPNVDEFGFTSPGLILRAQTSRDAELGLRWVDAGRRLDVRLYRSSLRDEIGYDPSAPNQFFPGANINFDATRRQGLELEHSEPLAEAFTLHVNGALRRATFRAGVHAGNDVPLTPRRTLSLRGEWQAGAGQQVDVLLNHVGAQSPDFDNACRMPSYTTLDLRHASRWQQFELSLGVANATGRKYYTQAFGCTAGVTGGIYPEAGRAFTASLRAAF
jgi:iron complex outermembrane receptor protein